MVHQLAPLLQRFFQARLAASVISPSRFANPSPPSGWVEDFHFKLSSMLGTQQEASAYAEAFVFAAKSLAYFTFRKMIASV